MSIAALSWVFGQDIRPSWVKFTLVALADCADGEGECYPSIEHICQTTSQDRKTVIDCLAKLQQIGLLADTGRRTGRTRQVKVLKIIGCPTDTDNDQHYTYRLTDEKTGEFYLGVRTCSGAPESDIYMGSGKWPYLAQRNLVILQKEIIKTYPSRKEAEVDEIALIRAETGNPLCQNRTNVRRKGTVCGTVPSVPPKSPVQPSKESRPRDTETSLEPSQNPNGSSKSWRFDPSDATHEQLRLIAPGWDRQALYEKYRSFFGQYEKPRSPQGLDICTDWLLGRLEALRCNIYPA